MLKMLSVVPNSNQEEEAQQQKLSQVINHNLETMTNFNEVQSWFLLQYD
jgi:hypothetical protein